MMKTMKQIESELLLKEKRIEFFEEYYFVPSVDELLFPIDV